MQRILLVGFGFMGKTMIPPVPFYKHCPEVLIHTTARAMDATFKL